MIEMSLQIGKIIRLNICCWIGQLTSSIRLSDFSEELFVGRGMSAKVTKHRSHGYCKCIVASETALDHPSKDAWLGCCKGLHINAHNTDNVSE